MAQKAKKDRAKANTQALNYLHYGTTRNIWAYVLLSLPPWIIEWFLEHNSRPTVDKHSGKLISAGEDLAAPGLTEYFFDIIWMHWISLIAVMIFGNWGWLVYSVVPMFGMVKVFGLWKGARGMMGGQGQMPEEQTPMGSGNRRQRRQQ
ncbi:hypothetical protein ACMFMG_011123 [Clarireedia jacksonii]